MIVPLRIKVSTEVNLDTSSERTHSIIIIIKLLLYYLRSILTYLKLIAEDVDIQDTQFFPEPKSLSRIALHQHPKLLVILQIR